MNKMDRLILLYGLKVLDYHGTPFITRTPFIYDKIPNNLRLPKVGISKKT